VPFPTTVVRISFAASVPTPTNVSDPGDTLRTRSFD